MGGGGGGEMPGNAKDPVIILRSIINPQLIKTSSYFNFKTKKFKQFYRCPSQTADGKSKPLSNKYRILDRFQQNKIALDRCLLD